MTHIRIGAVLVGVSVLTLSPFAPAKDGPARNDPAGDPLPLAAVARLGTLRWAHGTEVDFATYLRDGQQTLTADQDGLFRVWETATGKLLRQFGKGDCKQVYWHVYHRNEKSRVIDVVGSPNAKHVLAVSAAGETVAISRGDGNISLWEIATGKMLRSFEANIATTLAFSPDGNSLFTRGLDQLVRQYDTRTGKDIRTFGTLRSGEKLIYCNDAGGLMVSADGKTVFTIHLELSEKRTEVSVRSWDIATGREFPELRGKKPVNGFASVAFSPRAGLVAIGDLDGVIHVWDLIASKEVRRITGPKLENGGYSATMAFSPDGKLLLSRTAYELMQLWDMAGAKEVRQYRVPKDRSGDFFTGDLAFSSDGSRIISPGRAGTVRQIETVSGKEIELPVSRHRNLVEALALSPDGKTAVTLSHDHVLHRWNADDGAEIKHVRLPDHIDRASFSADGNILALAGYGEKLWLRHWDAVGLKELREWEVSGETDGRPVPFRRFVNSLALSASGKRLAVRDFDHALKIWEVPTEKDKTLQEHRLPLENSDDEQQFMRGNLLALSPDGTLFAELAKPKEGEVSFRLREATTGKLVRIFDIPQPSIRAFAFSPDGRTIAATKVDRTVTLWEVASGRQRASLGRERSGKSAPDQPAITKTSMMGDHLRVGELMCIAFSPAGNLVAAGDSAGRVRLFDLTTDKELDSLEGHLGPVVSVAFAANSRRLISGSTDTTAVVWEIPPRPGEAAQTSGLEQKQLEALWQDLGGEDAEKAFQAIRILRRFPNQVVPFLKPKMKVVEVDQNRLARLIGELDDARFVTREKAQIELQKMGELAEDAIRKALDAKPSAELQRRLEALWNRPRVCDSCSPDQLRALETLERIGTPEALKVAQVMARGTISSRITRDAQATVERMGSK